MRLFQFLEQKPEGILQNNYSENFGKFLRKQLWWRLKVAVAELKVAVLKPKACNLIKREAPARVLSYKCLMVEFIL